MHDMKHKGFGCIMHHMKDQGLNCMHGCIIILCIIYCTKHYAIRIYMQVLAIIIMYCVYYTLSCMEVHATDLST